MNMYSYKNRASRRKILVPVPLTPQTASVYTTLVLKASYITLSVNPYVDNKQWF